MVGGNSKGPRIMALRETKEGSKKKGFSRGGGGTLITRGGKKKTFRGGKKPLRVKGVWPGGKKRSGGNLGNICLKKTLGAF